MGLRPVHIGATDLDDLTVRKAARPGATTKAVAALQHQCAQATGGAFARRCGAGESGSDHNDVVVDGSLGH